MMVNMPQALSLNVLTTTMATPAKVATMINAVATVVTMPERGLIASRAILGKERPSLRTEARSTTKS